MMRRYARWITRMKWVIFAVWIVAVAAVLLFLPKLQDVVAHQSTTYLPNSATSIVAGNLANDVDPSHKAASTVIVAIRNPHGLQSADKQFLTDKLTALEAHASNYSITYVEDGENAGSGASHFESKDGTTEIALVGISKGVTDHDLPQVLNHLYSAFNQAPSGAHVYFTGDTPIQEDAILTTQSAANKTAVVTVVLVLAILLLVFRSVLAPLLTLIAIGLSYLVSSGVVAWTAQRGLPVSTFTQTFMIAVLFGAGTDYSMILLNRFREELTKTHDRVDALAAALTGVSKSVLFSSLTVLISFAVLYFANFGLYRSAVGVSIGIFITLITCLTLIPALMSVLGRALYWPQHPKPGSEHKPSRIWGWTGGISTRRPWTVMLVLAIVLTPIGLLFTGARTFNPMLDIPNAGSVAGFNLMSKEFGAGQAMPTTVVLQTKKNLRTSDGLAAIQRMSEQLANVAGVSEVDSATQPLGSVVKAFQLANQNQQAANSLQKLNTGLGQLGSQLNSSAAKSGQSTGGMEQLQSGSTKVTKGAQAAAAAATSIAQGGKQLTSGANQVESGLSKVNTSAAQLAQGTTALSKSEKQLASASSTLANAIAQWAARHPGDAGNPDWQQIQKLAAQLNQGTNSAQQSSAQLAGGVNQMAGALPRLQQGASGVVTGSRQLASGAAALATGVTQVAGGSSAVTTGLSQFAKGLAPMGSGLSQAGSSTQQLQTGLAQIRSFLSQSANAPSPGFYVPQSQIDSNKDLKQAMAAFISPDGHVAKFTVVLNSNPYSAQAIADVGLLKQAAQSGLVASTIHSGQIYVGGTSAVQANMNTLSNQDFTRTMSLIFAAIFILLMLMLRSVLTPLFILISLGATYFVTMGIVQTIAVDVLGNAGVSWSVPFFAFLLLVALGVDYCIFLMSRFDEEYRRTPALSATAATKSGQSSAQLTKVMPMPMRSMRHAMRYMGGVVFSAAMIMAGTFGSMAVTGITTMVEIGISIVIGLFLYTFVLLAFFMPASIALIGRAHAWPFDRSREEDEEEA